MLDTGQAFADSAGIAHFVRFSTSSFDQYTNEPSLEMQTWLKTHIWRLGVYSPYFDSKTSWYPNGWVYKDAYAIYTNNALTSEHPEWILRDGSGNKLYIPWGCSGGTCPQYAADISNRAFRRWWIEQASAEFAHGYRGVFVDDVNMDMRVGNGLGEAVDPIDPSTGQPMTTTAWREYMTSFMQEVRAALPTAEIVHNVIWYADNHAGTTDASIRNELSASDFVFLERGVNDSGLTGGTGQWSVSALLSYIDQVHALGRAIVLDGTASETPALEYNLAAYFLVSSGMDAVSGAGQTPETWWGGWAVNLGEPSGSRYAWNGLLRRDFSGGMVLVNQPGEPTRTVSLPAPMHTINGNTVSSVTLAAASGAILTGGGSSATTATESTSSSTPTTTTVETTSTSSTTESSTTTTSTGETTTSSTGTSGHGGKSTKTESGGKGKARVASHRARPHRKHRRHRHRRRKRAHASVVTHVYGQVLYAPRGTVDIQVDARRGARWRRLEMLSTKVDSGGGYARTLPLRAGRRYRLRAVYAGAPGYRPSRSRYRVIVPHAR